MRCGASRGQLIIIGTNSDVCAYIYIYSHKTIYRHFLNLPKNEELPRNPLISNDYLWIHHKSSLVNSFQVLGKIFSVYFSAPAIKKKKKKFLPPKKNVAKKFTFRNCFQETEIEHYFCSSWSIGFFDKILTTNCVFFSRVNFYLLFLLYFHSFVISLDSFWCFSLHLHSLDVNATSCQVTIQDVVNGYISMKSIIFFSKLFSLSTLIKVIWKIIFRQFFFCKKK